jgi:UDP-N-acetylmuramoylalanine--D-glutamate ligase
MTRSAFDPPDTTSDDPDAAPITSRNAIIAALACWDDLRDTSFTVVGLGKSGVSAANALCRRGARVLAVDDKPASQLTAALAQLDPRIDVSTGGSQGFGPTAPLGRRGDLFVLSPGIAPHTRLWRDVHGLALLVVSEIELFYRLDRASNGGLGHPIAAISGTDGKTTTTLLTAHLLEAGGYRAIVGGNIGDPLCDFLDTLGPSDVVVAEVSAFQLRTCSRFRPRVAVVTNIAQDHLDWFSGDMDAYVQTKVSVGQAMGSGDTLVMNGDDPELASYRAIARPHACWTFTTQGVPDRGFGFDGTDLWWCLAPGAKVAILPASELGSLGRHPITGLHNVENALSACGMVLSLGVPLEAVRQGLRTFTLPSHRMEPVGSIGAIRFIDDSKATNPHAAIAGLTSVVLAEGERLIWIGGGSEKDADFSELGQVVGAKASAAILLGQTADRIATVLPAGLPVERCDRLEDAVPLALQLAGSRGVVLLSPACASFDMFRSYAHRGEVFSTAVERLQAALDRHTPRTQG